MTEKATEGDSVVVSFSGYELRFAGDDAYYLCPADANKADKESLIALSEVCAALDGSKAASKAVVIDSCRSLEGRKEGGAKSPKAPPKGVAVLFACSAGEYAYEVADKRAGLLTHFLCEGLRGAGDADRDGNVAWSELVSHAKARLAAHGKDNPDRQVPELIGETREWTANSKKR